MKNFPGIVFALVVAASACMQVSLAADKQTPENPKLVAPKVDAAWDRRIPVFEIDDLPLFEVVTHLRDLFPELNFLVRNTTAPGAKSLDIAGVSIKAKLRNVTLAEILKATELASDHPIKINASREDRLIVFEAHDKTVTGEKPPIVTRAYNLGDYLAGLNEEQTGKAMQDLHEVIFIAGRYKEEIAGGQRIAPKIHFHPGTKLLIAIGRPDEMEIVEQIAGELQVRGGRGNRSAVMAPATRNNGTGQSTTIR